jgi:VIT1/CCC1 family predicted Fe2+/Mn2+ transporter
MYQIYEMNSTLYTYIGMYVFRHDWIKSSLREIVFGLEDALVSTLGALTGIAIGSGSTFIVILSGLVLIAAESTSMAAGSYLSSKSVRDKRPIRAGFVMGVFYLFGGFVPLIPYLLLDVSSAIVPSIVATSAVLFGLGVWASGFTKRGKIKSGLEMLGVSLFAALIGYVVGRAVGLLFGIEISL